MTTWQQSVEGLPVLDYDKGFKARSDLEQCPCCGSQDQGGYEGAECNGSFWFVPQQCNACGATWDIVLGGIGIADIQPGQIQ